MAEEHQNIALDCGIAYARLEAWLSDELALPHCYDGLWVYEYRPGPQRTDSALKVATCYIELSRLENRELGNFALERTQLSIDGDVEAVTAFMKLFTLRFVSAGG